MVAKILDAIKVECESYRVVFGVKVLLLTIFIL